VAKASSTNGQDKSQSGGFGSSQFEGKNVVPDVEDFQMECLFSDLTSDKILEIYVKSPS